MSEQNQHRPGSIKMGFRHISKGAVEPPMAAKDGKAVAQVLDSKRDHSEAMWSL
jgi:hypothetical protein